MLRLDDFRLDALVNLQAKKNQLHLTAFESRLADAWYHLRLLETTPRYLRNSEQLHMEINRVTEETSQLTKNSENVKF